MYDSKTERPSNPHQLNAESLGFCSSIHFLFDRFQNKTVQAFSLFCSVLLDNIPLSLLDYNIDSIVRFFVVPCSSFLLRIRILHRHHLLVIY